MVISNSLNIFRKIHKCLQSNGLKESIQAFEVRAKEWTTRNVGELSAINSAQVFNL